MVLQAGQARELASPADGLEDAVKGLGLKVFSDSMVNSGKENGNYYSRLGVYIGLYRDNGKENGKENGNYYNEVT